MPSQLTKGKKNNYVNNLVWSLMISLAGLLPPRPSSHPMITGPTLLTAPMLRMDQLPSPPPCCAWTHPSVVTGPTSVRTRLTMATTTTTTTTTPWGGEARRECLPLSVFGSACAVSRLGRPGLVWVILGETNCLLLPCLIFVFAFTFAFAFALAFAFAFAFGLSCLILACHRVRVTELWTSQQSAVIAESVNRIVSFCVRNFFGRVPS